MFKCLDIAANEPVVSLDDRGPTWRGELRRKGSDGLLRCPTCREAVVFRAGEVNRPHFAHKTLANCPTRNESPDLLEARAVLYQWLRSKFGDGVTLEEQIDGHPTPRPFDCWARHGGRQFAYWLIDKRVAPEGLSAIEAAAQAAGASLTWALLSKVLRRLDGDPRLITLSTTERACLARCRFDRAYARRGAGTLHYLDAEAGAMTTFRACWCQHRPQVYGGYERTSPLGELLVLPATGEFVHPGEHERLSDARRRARDQALRRRSQRQQRRREAEQCRREAEQRRQAEEQRQDEEQRRRREAEQCRRPPVSPAEPWPQPPGAAGPQSRPAPDEERLNRERVGVCRRCGQVTSDWFIFYGADGTCLCNACRQEAEGR